MKKIAQSLFVIFALALGSTHAAEQRALNAQTHLPLQGLDNKTHHLSDYLGQGKWVIVNVWAEACPYCRQELFDLTRFHDEHHKTDAMVIGLTLDFPSFGFPNTQSLQNFALDYFIDYPLLLVDRELASQVIGKPVDMIPLTFIYTPEGKLVHQINGVVTEKMLDNILHDQANEFRIEWAEEVPPEFQPQES